MIVFRKLVVALTFVLFATACGPTDQAALLESESEETVLAFASPADAPDASTDEEDDSPDSDEADSNEDEDADDDEADASADDSESDDDEDADSDDSDEDADNDEDADSDDDADAINDESDDSGSTATTSNSDGNSVQTSNSPASTTAAGTRPAPTTAAPTTAPPTTPAPTTAAPTTAAPTTAPPTTPAPTTAAPTTAAPATGETSFEAAVSNQVFRIVNCARTGQANWCEAADDDNWNQPVSASERPGTALTRSATLNTSSVAWSEQLAVPGQAFAHSPGSGNDYGENVAWFGRSTTGNSITPPSVAKDVARQLMTQWMNSPGHRTNLLRASYDTMGVGTALVVNQRDYAVYGTQQFS